MYINLLLFQYVLKFLLRLLFDTCSFRSVLFTLHLFGDFSVIFLLRFSTLLPWLPESRHYISILLKCTKVCFMAQLMYYLYSSKYIKVCFKVCLCWLILHVTWRMYMLQVGWSCLHMFIISSHLLVMLFNYILTDFLSATSVHLWERAFKFSNY